MSDEAPEDRTPADEVEDRIESIKEDMSALQTAESEQGILQHKMVREIQPLDALISELNSEVDDIREDEFLTGQDEADALRTAPDVEDLNASVDELDLDPVDTLGEFKAQLEDTYPGLDFSGEASTTIEQVATILTDYLAGRQKTWSDRLQRKQDTVNELQSDIEDAKRKLRKFANRHDIDVNVEEIEPDDD